MPHATRFALFVAVDCLRLNDGQNSRLVHQSGDLYLMARRDIKLEVYPQLPPRSGNRIPLYDDIIMPFLPDCAWVDDIS